MSRKSKKIAEKPTSLVPVSPTALDAVGSALKLEFEYTSEDGQIFKVYSINGQPLVSTEIYNLAVAENPSGQLGVALIANKTKNNPFVDAHIRVLRTLQTVASNLDTKALAADKKPYNYGALFPTGLEVFTSEDDRLGVFLGYHPVIRSYLQLVPMSLILDEQRVDLKTAAWMLGKTLKLMGFLHDLKFALGFVDASNLFIELAEHGVFSLDLTYVNEEPTDDELLNEVAQAAKTIWWAAGGSDSAEPPYTAAVMTEEQHTQFIAFLKKLMEGKTSAREAHTAAYEMFDAIWPKQPGGSTGGLKRDWHTWTVYPRES